MQVIRDPQAMRAFKAGRRLGLVPTMGYLHAGHLALVAEARKHAELVVASIFVNPSQFGPNEDFSRYPRDEAGDLAKLESAGVDAVFMPSAEAVYPSDFATWVVPEKLTERLCGASRPGHFRGVATVVTLLFRMTGCDVAVFGEKDFQQLAIIRRMNRDLWLGVEVIGAPIVRESDGLAMSSRNVYLNGEERRRALALSRALFAIAERARSESNIETLLAHGRTFLDDVTVDYLEIVDAETLEPITHLNRDSTRGLDDGIEHSSRRGLERGPEVAPRRPARALVAARVGATRLIDNVPL